MIRILACSLLLAPLAAPAHAQRVSNVSGNRLLELCTARASAGGCEAYVTGVADALAETDTKAACIPRAVTGKQLRDVTIKFIQSHPETREQSAARLTIKALGAAWRCGA